ncbi:Spindle assembly abnormal protein [Citrus sinensis]|uniref:Spindle assembly abnormal protein n=1 Tax=Citrus sinensis TaxID=2711 RepID=A0ACB8I6E6_CITSI|nr:Spindle assembly abnormal protein [Citrus sinensis]
MSKTKQLSPPEQMVKEGNFLEPVPPFYQGQGFPYAPTDWPGPGETWGWKVGRRISSCGYYTDRFLIPPRSLQKPSCPRYFASRRSIELYILKEFPDADIDAFFASFIWRVPSTLWHSTKVKAASLSPKKVEEVKEETPVTVRRKRKHTAAASLAKQRTRQSLRRSSGVITKDTDGKIDSCSLNNEAAILGKDMKSTSDSGDDQPGCDPIEGNNFRGKCIPENFDSYINSIDDILAHPLSEACFAYAGTSSSSQEEELAEAQILEDKKAKALSLKKEFYEMKDNIFQLQSELDSNLLAVKEIDDQIAMLQSERAELMATIEFRKAAKVKLDNDQQKVVNAIRKIVHVVQLANSKKG